jgi:ATP-binding cassette subfamily F protein uup
VEYFADLSQWEQAAAAAKSATKPVAALAKPAPTDLKRKLSYMEVREWEQIEVRIQDAEAMLERARRQLELPEIVSNPARLTEAAAEIDQAQAQVDRLYQRWAELDAKRA